MNINNLQNIQKAPDNWSPIFDFKEDLVSLKEKVQPYEKYEKIIVIGNGGSITSLEAYYRALSPKKEVFILSTMEPRLLKDLKLKCHQEETLVLIISKSGENLGPIESLLAFDGYPTLVITNPNRGALREIAKIKGWEIIPHPEIGGRFSGGTATAIVPSLLCGLDIEKILDGLQVGYGLKDQAYSLSSALYDLEQKGITEIYLPIYSNYLMGFLNMIVQLMHESVCKDNKGQTFYGAFSPESQHHTNQRFLGGKKNVAAIFLTYQGPKDLKISVADELKEVQIRSEKLDFIDGIAYQDSLLSEYLGTKQDADKKGITNFTIDLPEINELEVGTLLGFWHLVAFYSSVLRNVNPFDQPAVEDSKAITVDEIKRLSRV